MLVIKIELWPRGDESKKQTLGIARIINDGTGTPTRGNYRYILYGKNQRVLRTGNVQSFPRQKLLSWDILLRVLKQAFGGRNES